MTHDRTKLQAAAVYLRRRIRAELADRPDLVPMLAEALSVLELAVRPPDPVRVARLAKPQAFAATEWGRTEFAGRRVEGDTLMATLLAPLP